MNKRLIRLLASSVAILAASALPLRADLLIDRGLPVNNLNNAAGANRSNVAWADDSPILEGDTFTNTSAGSYAIDTIRLWAVGSFSSVSLLGGVSGSASYGLISSSVVTTAVTYAGGDAYQGTAGGFIGITQLDFAVNVTLGVGETFNFFLNGSGANGPYVFAHASNAALGGAPADGADNTMLSGSASGGSIAAADISTWTSLGNGWDKPSDLNVQVFGKARGVPDSASTVSLVALALMGVAAARRRR